MGEGDGPLDEVLARIEEAGTEALTAMRRAVGILRDAEDAAGPAGAPPDVERLAELVERFRGRGTGPAVRLNLPAEPAPWPPEVTTTIHRIVQESLTNIARHAAHARSATIDVAQDRDAVTVSVVDDAPPTRGHHPHRASGTPGGLGSGFGLIGMRERVEALGGRISSGPEPAGGWAVRATVPIPSGPRR
jgi:signal transduction histidine kinase